MKLAASNIALPAFNHAHLLPRLAEMGLEGLEVAPSRVWKEGWNAASAASYRKSVETAGLRVAGLHSLFFDRPHLGLFKGVTVETADFLVALSALCRDLGGRTLIYGGGRRRDGVTMDEASAECRRLLEAILPRFAEHGTILCFEPLGPKDTDFLNTVGECLGLAREFDHPALAIQLDAKALVDNGEARAETVEQVKHRLVHVHANEPGLGVLASSGAVDHAALASWLKAAGYEGFVSIEQRMLAEDTAMADLAQSAAILKECYG